MNVRNTQLLWGLNNMPTQLVYMMQCTKTNTFYNNLKKLDMEHLREDNQLLS